MVRSRCCCAADWLLFLSILASEGADAIAHNAGRSAGSFETVTPARYVATQYSTNVLWRRRSAIRVIADDLSTSTFARRYVAFAAEKIPTIESGNRPNRLTEALGAA